VFCAASPPCRRFMVNVSSPDARHGDSSGSGWALYPAGAAWDRTHVLAFIATPAYAVHAADLKLDAQLNLVVGGD
jgi:hypothetical protein